MKFGPVALAEAAGAILAHSEHLPDGRLRKGQVLAEADIARLRAAGFAEVVVAVLEPEDLHEDAAAARLAETVLDGAPGLSLSRAFTGRVNLVAEAPGVVAVDAAKVTAANMLDPMITLATVAPWFQTHPGGMVATVKIISYGVASEALDRAAEAARGAIRLHRPRFETASLIVSDTAEGPGLRGVEAIRTRLAGLGMRLKQTLSCPHEIPALARAMASASGELVLVLTGSATSDLRDTGPEALRRAGGAVERFGIPVDPGNLLFTGRLGERPVIGLPNSARSPVLHGVDWVLARIACGAPIGDADFAAMGVGGLLKEIPTRPQPRQRRPAG
ncbi:molybdopterin biosynthesis protein [Roseovarius atlanticus]|uniref:Molybdopterin biosynthesis protein n=1 Tax=Roseovarius atlanticus TaxID=1641875 RepID=A0A0T5P0A7_9RHOB|nr:molybdopterin-binding protein [Roseovarius atlanticus]KRS14537.1 molybdopterin biosynthesis protein [Roseovarius atlanticus]